MVGAGLAATAGCLGGADEGTAAEDHPAMRGVDDQPALGPPPGDAEATIVAFEDPSCHRCRAFALETVPKIESNLVEPGTATYVYRWYPVVYEWGKPATKSLAATFERDADAFWALQEHYYRTQSEFSTGNVLDRTRAFLDAETAVDGTEVVDAVEAGEADDAVQRNLDAGEAADANTTPSVYLFKEGEFRTKASGSVSYDAIESALGL
ncbi:disulfide bond formation protein DsbA [Halobacteriales archaeon QS_1_68_20]|nr:MAG: disulfide bond formation protein DsbA [Halobacteriales archaeon QS_1_68_20]